MPAKFDKYSVLVQPLSTEKANKGMKVTVDIKASGDTVAVRRTGRLWLNWRRIDPAMHCLVARTSRD